MIAVAARRHRDRPHHLLAGPRAVDRAHRRRRVPRVPPGGPGPPGRARRPGHRRLSWPPSLIAVTPLQGMISQRLANGASDAARGSLAVAATRRRCGVPAGRLRGHPASAGQRPVRRRWAARPSARPAGNGTIGGNGQLWLLLICDGFLGAALYVGFFALRLLAVPARHDALRAGRACSPCSGRSSSCSPTPRPGRRLASPCSPTPCSGGTRGPGAQPAGGAGPPRRLARRSGARCHTG